jgi:hypothetical protein
VAHFLQSSNERTKSSKISRKHTIKRLSQIVVRQRAGRARQRKLAERHVLVEYVLSRSAVVELWRFTFSVRAQGLTPAVSHPNEQSLISRVGNSVRDRACGCELFYLKK